MANECWYICSHMFAQFPAYVIWKLGGSSMVENGSWRLTNIFRARAVNCQNFRCSVCFMVLSIAVSLYINYDLYVVFIEALVSHLYTHIYINEYWCICSHTYIYIYIVALVSHLYTHIYIYKWILMKMNIDAFVRTCLHSFRLMLYGSWEALVWWKMALGG